jgi:hypothetical protein
LWRGLEKKGVRLLDQSVDASATPSQLISVVWDSANESNNEHWDAQVQALLSNNDEELHQLLSGNGASHFVISNKSEEKQSEFLYKFRVAVTNALNRHRMK